LVIAVGLERIFGYRQVGHFYLTRGKDVLHLSQSLAWGAARFEIHLDRLILSACMVVNRIDHVRVGATREGLTVDTAKGKHIRLYKPVISDAVDVPKYTRGLGGYWHHPKDRHQHDNHDVDFL